MLSLNQIFYRVEYDDPLSQTFVSDIYSGTE